MKGSELNNTREMLLEEIKGIIEFKQLAYKDKQSAGKRQLQIERLQKLHDYIAGLEAEHPIFDYYTGLSKVESIGRFDQKLRCFSGNTDPGSLEKFLKMLMGT